MRYLLTTAAVVFFLVFSFRAVAQQLVQTPHDIYLLCQKDNEFVGKPLRVLLKEMKPPIKRVFAEGGWFEKAPMFSFFFVTKKGYNDCSKYGNRSFQIRVYLNEFFRWKPEDKDKNYKQYTTWTKEDEEKYGQLVVTAIRVSGNCHTCIEEPIL